MIGWCRTNYKSCRTESSIRGQRWCHVTVGWHSWLRTHRFGSLRQLAFAFDEDGCELFQFQKLAARWKMTPLTWSLTSSQLRAIRDLACDCLFSKLCDFASQKLRVWTFSLKVYEHQQFLKLFCWVTAIPSRKGITARQAGQHRCKWWKETMDGLSCWGWGEWWNKSEFTFSDDQTCCSESIIARRCSGSITITTQKLIRHLRPKTYFLLVYYNDIGECIVCDCKVRCAAKVVRSNGAAYDSAI